MIRKSFLVILFFVLKIVIIYSQDSGVFNKQILFKSNTNGNRAYRIPSIVTTTNGNILAFAEARKGLGGDWDISSIVMKKSTDNGFSWSDEITLVQEPNSQCSYPVPINDVYSNKIHLLYLIEHARIYYTISDNNGLTWKEPINITDVFNSISEQYPWRVIGIGPGHGTQLSNGRLIVPMWLSECAGNDSTMNLQNTYPTISGVLFSDDFGENWKIGDFICTSNDTFIYPNESSCVELKNNEVLFNIRNESKNYRRIVSTSPNGVSDWSAPYYSDNFFEPICHASMLRMSMEPYQSKNRILFCNPDSRNTNWSEKRGTTLIAGAKRQRSNLTIRMSYDEALTFPISKVIDSDYSGYSDLSVTNEGIILCLYESGLIKNSKFVPEHITLSAFDLQWLTDGKDKLETNDLPLNTQLLYAQSGKDPVLPRKRTRKNRSRSQKIC